MQNVTSLSPTTRIYTRTYIYKTWMLYFSHIMHLFPSMCTLLVYVQWKLAAWCLQSFSPLHVVCGLGHVILLEYVFSLKFMSMVCIIYKMYQTYRGHHRVIWCLFFVYALYKICFFFLCCYLFRSFLFISSRNVKQNKV